MFNNNLFNSAQDNQSNDSSKIAKNPFKQEEVLQAWLESDVDYNKAKLRARKILQPNKPQFFMSFKDSYLSFVHLITKNAIVATLLMLVSAGAVSASALQAFGPDEYKPSTIIQKTFNPKDFAVNTVKEKNPYTPLNWDENNNVTFIDACDLAIKYPARYSDGQGTIVYSSVDPTGNNQPRSIYITASDENLYNSYSGPSLNCFIEKPNGLEEDLKYEGEAPRSVFGKILKIDGTQFIKDSLGWFITQSELKNVTIYQNNISPEVYTIYFVHNNLHYLITYQTSDYTFNKLETSTKVNVFKGKEIQVQFISLVSNQANKIVVDGTGKVIDQKTILDSTTAITVEPKNASLEKITNTIPYVTDGYGQNGICGIFGVTSYKFPGDAEGGYMLVTSSKLNLDDMQKKSFSLLSDFLDGKTDYSPDYNAGRDYISQFASACSGFPGYNPLIQNNQDIVFPGTDKAKVLYLQANQGFYPNPVVVIFAQKGDQQLFLTKLIKEPEYNLKELGDSCGLAELTPPLSAYECFDNKLKNDPKLKELMDKGAKDLIKTFELK